MYYLVNICDRVSFGYNWPLCLWLYSVELFVYQTLARKTEMNVDYVSVLGLGHCHRVSAEKIYLSRFSSNTLRFEIQKKHLEQEFHFLKKLQFVLV